MFYNVTHTLISPTKVDLRVELIDKTPFFTEIARTLNLSIPIEEGRRVFDDEIAPMVEGALAQAGIEVDGKFVG